MAEGQVVWVAGSSGALRGFHESCATWLGLEPGGESREPYHTEICRGCGQFLLTPAPEHVNEPRIDPKDLLG